MIDFNNLPAQDKLYYLDAESGIAIYCADARDILPAFPDKCVDLVLTDPPYGIGEMVSGTMNKNRLHKTSYSSFVDGVDYIKDTVLPAIVICQHISERMIITPGSKNMCLYPQWDSLGSFYQPAAVGMQLWGRMDSQPILYYGKPYDIGKTIKRCSYTLIERPSTNLHPCAKPIKVWTQIIADRSDVGHTILDPFLGSGTTLYCAKKLNRRAIGIEIEEKYCRIAADRCRQMVFDLKV